METHSTHDSGLGRLLAEIIATYRQLSAFSAQMFEPIARLYVGNLATRLGREDPIDVVNLAIKKLLYEAGELLTASAEPGAEEKHAEPSEPSHDVRTRAADTIMSRLATQEDGIPDLKLAYVAAAVLMYMKRRDQRETAEAERAANAWAAMQRSAVAFAAPTVRSLRIAPRAMMYGAAPAYGLAGAPTMASYPRTMYAGAAMYPGPYDRAGSRFATYDVRATKGCGCSGGCGCGGGGTRPPPPQPPCYDPCAGGLPVPPPPRDVCSPGCSCSTCQCKGIVPVPPEKCPPCFSISCETRMKLRECLRIAICELLKTYAARLPACQPVSIGPNQPPIVAALQKALCSFLECVPEALCPTKPPVDCGPKVPMPCLPCDYAVEWKEPQAEPPPAPNTDVIL